MVEFFEQRTRAHIARVARNLTLVSEAYADLADDLRRRGLSHDASKFGQVERVPYIWLTEYHRCRREGEPFTYPAGVKEQVKAAVDHHVTSNRHHAKFHSDPNDMTDVDLIEMVCDWTAMAQEYDEDGGSAKGWADKTVGTKVIFSPERTAFIYEVIDVLDRLVAEQAE